MFHIIFTCFFSLKCSRCYFLKQTSSIFLCKSQFWGYLHSQVKPTFYVMVRKRYWLVELLGIDICDFKDSSSVEDVMVDAYNTSGMQYMIILFQHFWCYFSSEVIALCTPNDLILKTSNDEGQFLTNAVSSSRSLEFGIISWHIFRHTLTQKTLTTNEYFCGRTQFFRRGHLVFNLYCLFLLLLILWTARLKSLLHW